MALEASSAWTKPAFRVVGAAIGSSLAGPLGCATGAFFGAMFGDVFGPVAANFVTSCVENFGESAAEKLLGPQLDSFAKRFREHSSQIEKVYREALRESLIAIHSQTSKEFDDWYENWNACLKSAEPLDLEQVQPGELVPQNLDEILCRTMRRLDAQGQALNNKSLSLKVEYRPLPDELAAEIKTRLPEHFRESFRALIVTDEYKQAWKEAEKTIQDWVIAKIADIDQRTRLLPSIAEQIDAIKGIQDKEFQKVFRVIDSAFLKSQKEVEETRFLSISKGDWALVARGRAIERDLAKQVASELLQPHDERMVLQTIRGEPGSGKTTLLLEIGARLVEAGCTVLEVLGGAPLDDFRYYATKLSNDSPRRLFFLIDDIYRDEEQADLIVEVFSNLGELLPISIIATTPSFADRTKSIRASSYLDMFPAVSPDNLTDNEIDQLRKMPSVSKLGPKLIDTLIQARRILVVMLQLTEGKPIEQILLETARHLKKNFPETYRAWGIVSLFSARNLPIPSSLLNAILGAPYFTDSLLKTPAKIGSEGIIFPSSFLFKESWFAGHVLIAQYAYKVEFADKLRQVCVAAADLASPSDPEHSVFLGRMLRFLSTGSHGFSAELPLATDVFNSYEEKIRNMAMSYPEGMADWALAFRRLGQRTLAEQCLLKAKPTTPGRAVGVIRALEQLGKTHDAVAVAAKFLDSSPNDNYVRTYHLGLVERHGTPTEVQEAIAQTESWLASHLDDSSMRTAFLGLVERHGIPTEVEETIAQTEAWLFGHSDDTSVRTAFLDLVEQKGTPPQMHAVIAQTGTWLTAEEHYNVTGVRIFYLGLVKRHGTGEQLKDAIVLTEAWLAAHSDNDSVRTAFLNLIEQKGTPLQIQAAIAQTATWLNAEEHADVVDVRGFYLGLVERHGTGEQMMDAIAQTEAWLAEHSDDTSVRIALLDLIEQKGTPLEVQGAIAQTAKWLDADEHAEVTDVRTFYLGLVERRANHNLEKAIDETDCWLRKHTGATDVWNALIAVLVRNGYSDRAVEITSAAIGLNPGDLNLTERYVDLIASHGSPEDVARIFDELEARFPRANTLPLRRARWLFETGNAKAAEIIYRELLKKHPKWPPVHYAYGRCLLELEKWEAARKEFDIALRLYASRNQMAHEGAAQALRGLAAKEQEAGHYKTARDHLQRAESHFRFAIHWAKRQSAPAARFYASIGWFYLDQHRFNEALTSFDAAVQETPEHFSNYWGRGAALRGLGRPAEAIVALENALAKAPQPLEPPAKEEIPQLLEECRRDLE